MVTTKNERQTNNIAGAFTLAGMMRAVLNVPSNLALMPQGGSSIMDLILQR